MSAPPRASLGGTGNWKLEIGNSEFPVSSSQLFSELSTNLVKALARARPAAPIVSRFRTPRAAAPGETRPAQAPAAVYVFVTAGYRSWRRLACRLRTTA